MKECEAVLQFNERFFGSGKKYIDIDGGENSTDSWAMDTMLLLSEQKIFIDGFISENEEYIGAIWNNKKVSAMAECDESDFICTKQNLYQVSRNLEDKIVIYGAGLNGRKITEILRGQGKEVLCYVDTNLKGMEKKELLGKTIRSVDFIAGLDESCSVIAAGVAWEEMAAAVRGVNPKVSIFWFEQDCLCGTCVSNMHKFMYFDGFVRNKSIYLYGVNDVIKRFIRLVRFMGYLIEGILADEDVNEEIEGIPVKPVEEIAYKSDFFIMAANKSRKEDYKTLTDLGLLYALDFSFILSMDISLQFVRKTPLDVNMGYTYTGTSKYPGFTIYGNDCPNDFKIVTLGGSTTDGALYPFKSWPEILYEKWSDRDVTVFNGGVVGYNSGQELFKLIRDVLDLKPDMIIEYGSFNEVWENDCEPYAFSHVKGVFEYANKHLNNDFFFQAFTDEPICTGIRKNRTKASIWLRNIKMMHELSVLSEVQFYAFIQPDIFTKMHKNAYEKGIWMNDFDHIKEVRLDFIRYVREKHVVQTYDYIYDLTSLFDDQFDVYMDIAHVNEKGNYIIAGAIAEITEKE